ncbi:MAG: hypothetical protein INF52_10770 [Rhodobacter sp.]|nr:hypothetical protein [Rhodobacter sp.]
MRSSIKLLLCCLFLAGCAEAEAEVAMKALDFSKPVPPHTFFVECGPLEGITMYPVPLAGKYTVEGKYRLSSSSNDLTVMDMSKLRRGDRVIISIPDDDRDAGFNANFFVHGLAHGCTGVFAANRVDIMTTQTMLASASEIGLTLSPDVNEAYFAIEKDNVKRLNMERNALFIDIYAMESPKVESAGTFMILDGDVVASEVVKLGE